MTEISDRPITEHDLAPCPPDCQRSEMHRHLKDGTTQTAYRGFGVTDTGRVIHGPSIPT